jgi:hypothetical protein
MVIDEVDRVSIFARVKTRIFQFLR